MSRVVFDFQNLMARKRILGALWLTFSLPVLAELSVSDTPLSLAAGVAPNIVLAIDDSGSMDAEILMPTNDGALWWHTGNESFVGLNAEDNEESAVINVNRQGGANGTWKKYVYLFPNGHGAAEGRRVYNDRSNDHFAVPPTAEFAFARSPDYNRAYFNPLDLYIPWPTVGSNSFSSVDPAAAPSDPVRGSFTFNLTADINAGGDNYTFRFFRGMTLPNGDTASDNSNRQVRYYPATFYLKEALPSAFGYTGATLTGAAPDGSSLIGYQIKPVNFSSTAAYNVMMQNFANWFSYYRKRHLATRAGVALSFFDVKNARLGEFTINNRDTVAMKTLSVDTERNAIFSQIYSRGGNSAGTPNRQALNHIGTQLQRTGSAAPITHACQANAAILFTDGYSNPGGVSSVANADGDKGFPYADTQSNTMADIAMYYYANNLRPDYAAGQVPVDKDCNLGSPPPSLDCNTNPHMLTYAVTLGTRGFLFDPESPANPYISTPVWPSEFPARSPTAVDDLWHATINGRGELLNASKPVEIAGKLKSAVTKILQSVGSASAVAANSTRLDTETRVFQARYDSRDWSGQILAYQVESDGALSEIVWNSQNADKIPEAALRNIFTWTTLSDGSTGGATSFQWDLLHSSQQALVAQGVDVAEVGTVGPQRVAWLRGDQSLEGVNEGFRIRSHRLGDIVNSNPFYHGGQDFGFGKLSGAEGSSYAAYLSSKAGEPAMLYVGANDGMLHAFRASDGVEQFAYVPFAVYSNLHHLITPDYDHKYFVDGSPRVMDAYFGNAWHSVLVGATGAGGGSVFAIDVSDPDSLSANDVLWDFSTTSDASHKLGLAMSDPVVARLESGDWVAIFGNGYNSSDTVKLFVVSLSDGSLMAAIDTGVDGANNGLSDVVPVDTDDDRITEYVYAGDLAGNVWKFDLTNSASTDWQVAYATDASEPTPLYTATDPAGAAQAITGKMTVGRHPDGGSMVYFGTGKYFENGDATVGDTPQLQSFYGIHDDGEPVSGRSVLQGQTISNQGGLSLAGTDDSAGSELRVVSNNAVDYSSQKGWYLDLKLTGERYGGGERVIYQPTLRYDRVIFPTLIPSADPCNFGGTGWLMELDAMTGGRLNYSVFDANNDGLINSVDWVEIASTLYAPSGKKFDQMITRPGIVGAGEKEYKYTSGSRGTMGVTAERGGGAELGRQSWWQLR